MLQETWDVVASASSLVLPRAVTDMRGRHSTLHYILASARYGVLCRSSREGRRRGDEREDKGMREGAKGEGAWVMGGEVEGGVLRTTDVMDISTSATRDLGIDLGKRTEITPAKDPRAKTKQKSRWLLPAATAILAFVPVRDRIKKPRKWPKRPGTKRKIMEMASRKA